MNLKELKELIETYFENRYPDLKLYEQSENIYNFRDIENEYISILVEDDLFLKLGTKLSLPIPINKVVVHFICDALESYAKYLVGKRDLKRVNRYLSNLNVLNDEENIIFLEKYFKKEKNTTRTHILEYKKEIELILEVLEEKSYTTNFIKTEISDESPISITIFYSRNEDNHSSFIQIFPKEQLIQFNITVVENDSKVISKIKNLSIKDITKEKLEDCIKKL